MKTNEILMLDCREKENIKIIKKVLTKIFNEENVKLNTLEQYVANFGSTPIALYNDNGEIYFSIYLHNKIIRSITLYELFAKATIYLFSKGKNKK